MSEHDGVHGALPNSISVEIGANFAGADFATAGIEPPDSNGAVGPGHFVELLNGAYRVYDKSGVLLEQSSLFGFWSAAGLAPVFPFDPRLIFDHDSGHWFAAALDSAAPGFGASRFLLAVSNGSDPTEGWQALPVGETFDFTRLGINQDGVFLVATSAEAGATIVAIPKADLLAASPSVSGATTFEIGPLEAGFDLQPAIAFGLSGREPFLSTQVTVSSLDGPIEAPRFNAEDRDTGLGPGEQAQGAVQKGTEDRINTDTQKFSSSVVLQDGKLFGVQTNLADDGHAQLRWVEIGDPLGSPVVLDSGVIHPPGLDVYFGSIAVNPLGQAVIGFTGSGPDDYPSAFAVAGILDGDDLEFGEPILLKAGLAPYIGVPAAFGARWGDYSATTYDPDNPSHFWTVQEWAEGPFDWATQISEIVFRTSGSPSPGEIVGVDWDVLAARVTTYFGATGQWGLIDDWLAGNPPDGMAADYLLFG